MPERRMRVLIVVSSSNQMYSGIGRNVFELARHMAGRVDFEFAIDDGVPRNRELVEQFAREHEVPVHVGRGITEPDALDFGNAGLGALLRRRAWDLVECLCWANAATNFALLEDLGETPLAYTPHDQPIWTVPMSPEQAARTDEVHSRTLARADVVFCDSASERATLQRRVPDRNNCTTLPLGCDFTRFRPGSWPRKEQLLFVGDLREPRKRFDRVLAVFSRLVERRPGLKLVVVGNKSDAVAERIPPVLRSACELRGYVTEAELRRAYAESLGLFLLSDFEAFGIPILEALASGTPVFLSEQAATRDIFGGFAGAHFCPADDLEATLAEVDQTLARGREAIAETAAEYRRLRATFDWPVLAHRKWQALAAAWFGRWRWAVPA